MHKLSQRYLVAFALLTLAAPLVLYFQYDVPPPASIGPIREAIPVSIGPWHMVSDRGPTDQEREILETDAILTRTYSSGAAVQCDLSVVFAQDNRRVAHPPELCYKGAGWTVESKKVILVPLEEGTFHVNRLFLLRGQARMWVYYWYKAGPDCSANYVRMQWNIVKSHFLRRHSSSALMRGSAVTGSPDQDAATLATLDGFARLAIPVAVAAVP